MTSDLVIVGAGGHGREAAAIVTAINDVSPTWNVVGFVDDDARVRSHPIPVLGPVVTELLAGRDHTIAVGDPHARAELATRLGECRPAAALVHPAASIGTRVKLGPGVIVAAGARLTTDITVGCHVHLNPNVVISHDCLLGDFVSCAPGVILSGEVATGDRVLFGSGSVVLPGCRIGNDVTVGAGAVVTTNIADGVTVTGVPARPTSSRPPDQH